jgi:hypothetical protein
MMQALQDYNPPSFEVPAQHDFWTIINALAKFLNDHLSQYEIPAFKGIIQDMNSGTQAFGLDLPTTATLNVTNWAHRISGTGTISTITPPNGFQSFIVLLSLNGFSFGGGGNISNPITVTAGHPALCIYDPTATGKKWWVLTA